MRRIRRGIIISLVATIAGIGSAVIIAIVAKITLVGNRCMGTLENPVVIVDRECCRFPARISCMAGFTGRRNAYGIMVRIGCLIVITFMATITGIRGIVIVALVACITISRDGGMGSGQWIVTAMNGKGGRCPAGVRSMAGFTGSRNANSPMVWITGLIVIALMAAKTIIRGVIVITLMADVTIPGNR